MRYVDPTGLDPIDAAWQTDFKNKHAREPIPEDVTIRLFSLAYPSEYKESDFYEQDGTYREGSIEKVFGPPAPAQRSWTTVPDALVGLASSYAQGEEEKFTRDIGTLFGGLKNRTEEPDAWAAISYEHNPARTWVAVNPGNLPTHLIGVDVDGNIHHWAWGVTMGGEYGPGGSMINVGREILRGIEDACRQRANLNNTWADMEIGNLGAAFGLNIRLMGLEPSHLRRVWNEYMLNKWW